MQANRHTVPTIVILEDDFLIAAAYSAMAEELGVEVLAICDSAETGIAAITIHQPTFVLLDVHLSGARDGIQVATTILQNEIDTRIVFATGSFDAQTVSRVRAIGEFDVLIKPINPSDFAAALSSTDTTRLDVERAANGVRDQSCLAQMARTAD